MSFNYDIVCLSEHWLKEQQLESTEIRNYTLGSFFARKDNIHGGSCIFARKELLFHELADLKSKSKELVLECSALNLPHLMVIVMCVYRSPAGNLDEFLEILNDVLTTATTKFQRHTIFLCGDFNLNFLNGWENRVKIFKDLLLSYNLLPTVTQPTRVTQSSTTLMENIFADVENYKVQVIPTALSDHYAQEIRVQMQCNIKRAR